MFELRINEPDMKKYGLNLPEYLLLGYLRFYNNRCIDDILEHTITETLQIDPIISSLTNRGFIRIIDRIIHIDHKAEKIFDGKYESRALELLSHFNKLKSEHLGITRATTAPKYAVKFKSLLSEGHDIEFIKEVLEYCISTWKDDDFMRNHINVETFCRHFDKYADQYEMRQKTNNTKNRIL